MFYNNENCLVLLLVECSLTILQDGSNFCNMAQFLFYKEEAENEEELHSIDPVWYKVDSNNDEDDNTIDNKNECMNHEHSQK